MSKKSLGGAAYFEAMGRRSVSLHTGLTEHLKVRRRTLPDWAIAAYYQGRVDQMACIPKGVITHRE